MNWTFSESFAGIGAWGKAINRVTKKHNDTCELKWYAKIDKYASNSFAAIHNVSEKLNIWDITKDTKVPEVDIFFYSPPCQTFSIAGARKLATVPKGNLFYNALDKIKQIKPKYLIMENVKGLVSGAAIEDFKYMFFELERNGYFNYYKVLNSKDYGIPQNRERVFIVSIRKDLYNQGKRFEFPQSIKLEKTLDNLTDDFENEEYALNKKELEKVLVNVEDIKRLTEYGDFRYDEGLRVRKNRISPCVVASSKPGDISGIPLKIIKVKSNTKVGYEIASPGDSINLEFLGSETRRGRVGKKVSQTLTTSCGISIYKGHSIFKFSPLICFRLQGFDDEDYYKAVDSLKKTFDKISDNKIKRLMYTRAGNSITVNVIEELLENLLYDRKQIGNQLSMF